MPYDLFLSYAGRDRAHVERLFKKLASIYGAERVFWDSASTTTQPFTASIPEALKGSQAVVFLVTDAWSGETGYPKDEVSVAIDHAREEKTPVPILFCLDGVRRGPAAKEFVFGVNSLPCIVPPRAWDTDFVAAEIVTRVPPRPRPVRDFSGHDTVADVLDAAVDLDRSAQWMRVVDICRDVSQPAYLLLHGEHRQDLRLFCERVRRRLSKRAGAHHVIELRYRVDDVYASTAELWVARLSRLDGCHPVRLLVAAEGLRESNSLVDAVARMLGRADGFFCEELPQVEFPSAGEISAWITRQRINGRPIDRRHPVVGEILTRDRQLQQEGGLTFKALTTLLDEELEDLRVEAGQ